MEFKTKWDLKRITPLRMTILYTLSGGLWILFSDSLLGFIVIDHQLRIRLSTVSGWLYIAVTAVFLYFLFHLSLNSLRQAEKTLLEEREQLVHQAHHDTLTGLPNRLLFNEHVNLALARARRRSGRLAVLFLDLDRFKLINDTMGHSLGDLLLNNVAKRIREILREGDVLARQGGDEFLILLSEICHEQDAVKVSELILGVFSQPLMLEGNEVYVSTSIGISLYPSNGDDLESLVKQADTAMYYAKEQGRNNYQFFTAGLNIKANDRLSIENSLRRALEREEFVLHYQPQVDFESGIIVGLEALIRWNASGQGIVSPAAFIPIAEETGLIVPIGEWVLRTACAQNMAWQKQGYPLLRIAVNISARQFRAPNFIKTVAGILLEIGMDPQWLELEITESIAMENGEASVEMLNSFKELGIRISIDDFGTGFSSLNYLRRMPIDTLKIDQSFIKDISTGKNGEEVVTAIIQLAKNLRLKVIAEGVETNNQWSFLKDKQCNEMQGFLFSKAVTSQELERLLECLPLNGYPVGAIHELPLQNSLDSPCGTLKTDIPD